MKATRIPMIVMVLLSLAVVFSFGISSVSADVYVSTTGNDSWDGSSATWVSGTIGPKLTIKNATGTATSGGTVRIANGTYNENGISITSKTLTVIGDNRDGTIINGGKTGRIFTVGGTGTFTFANLTFLNGNASTGQGGAISSYQGTALIVDNCTFINNTAGPNGGAISSNYNPLTVTNCNFINNRAGSGAGWGGAILAMGGGFSVPITITGNNFVNNSGGSGGALYLSYGSATIQFNRFIGNTPNTAQIDADTFASVNADLNWWGSNAGPSGLVTSRIPVNSWLVLNVTANPAAVKSGGTSTISANLLYDNGILTDPGNPDFYYHDPAFGHVPDGIPVTFATTLGSINSPAFTVNGVASSALGGLVSGVADVSATLDSETLHTSVAIDNVPPTAIANPPGGVYSTDKLVTLTMSEPGTIYYTTNGSTPTTSSNVYTGPLTISTTTTLKFLAVDLAGNLSPVYTQVYTIDKTPLTLITTNPKSGATGVSRTIPITLRFNKNIKVSINWSKIYVKNMTTGKLVAITPSISGNTLYIFMKSSRIGGNYYQVYIPPSAIKDAAGNNFTKGYLFGFRSA